MVLPVARGLALLFGLASTLCGSQAFFVAPITARAAGLATCGAADASWSCGYYGRGRWNGLEKRPERRGAQGSLNMDSLEEVPEELSDRVIAVECPVTGRTLDCYAERFAVVDGVRYLVAFPKDPAVAIAFDENGEVAPVPIDDPLMDELFPLAEACVADLGPGVTLLRTPTTLTARGLDELVGSLDGEGEEIEGDALFESADNQEEEEGQEEEGVGGAGGADEDEEEFFEDADEVELLGEFLLEGEEFLLVRFLEPLLVLAKEAEKGRFVLLSEDEDEDANPMVEELLGADAL